MRTDEPLSSRRRAQGGIASRLFFIFLAVVLIIIATSLTASLAAAETDWLCALCHSVDAVSANNANILRFQAHAFFQILAFLLSAIAAIHMFVGALLGVFAGQFFGVLGFKYWTLHGPEPERRKQLIKWFMRSFNLFIVAEVIASLSTSLNPSWKGIAVLMAVVIVRALLSVVLVFEEKNAPKESG